MPIVEEISSVVRLTWDGSQPTANSSCEGKKKGLGVDEAQDQGRAAQYPSASSTKVLLNQVEDHQWTDPSRKRQNSERIHRPKPGQ